MKVIITGATGAIGIALIKECINNQIRVLAICHRGSKRMERIPTSPLVHILELNQQEYAEYKPLEADYDVCYHMAWSGTTGEARNNMRLQNQNVTYALDAVALAHRFGCHTFIGAGSQAEYGRVEGRLKADTPVRPETGYGMAKLCAGWMTRVVCAQLNMKHIWTRILSVYGPYDGENSMIISSARKLLSGGIPQFTKGEQKWDYLYCDDAARALHLLAEKGKDGKVYCIGSGNAVPLCEYIEILRKSVSADAKAELGTLPYGDKQVMYLCADITELQEDTGFEPQIGFDEGIQRTIEWVKAEFGNGEDINV